MNFGIGSHEPSIPCGLLILGHALYSFRGLCYWATHISTRCWLWLEGFWRSLHSVWTNIGSPLTLSPFTVDWDRVSSDALSIHCGQRLGLLWRSLRSLWTEIGPPLTLSPFTVDRDWASSDALSLSLFLCGCMYVGVPFCLSHHHGILVAVSIVFVCYLQACSLEKEA